MKPLVILSLLSVICILGSCSSKSPYHDQVVAAARRDVEKVANAAPGSMEREHAVLAIRVRQHALSSNGHKTEADLYFQTANSLLVDSLHLIDCRQNDD